MSLKLLSLLVAALTAVFSLATVLRVYGMPVEARTIEPWLKYRSQIDFDFTAGVQPGPFYAGPVVRPDQLMRMQTPTDPPSYRRVLVSRYVDKLDIKLPYRFELDRPAVLRAQLRVDGQQVLPGVWQKPYSFVENKEWLLTGTQLAGTLTFAIPIRQFLSEMERNRSAYGISLEPMELRIQPILHVWVDGQRQPIDVVNTPEFVIAMRSGTVEVEEPRAVTVEKTLTDTRVVPITVTLFRWQLPVGWVRQGAMAVLGISLAMAALLIWATRRKKDPARTLEKLGPNLIRTIRFDPPANIGVAELRTVQELLQLQSQLERPVIRVGNSCYILDGTTCFIYRLPQSGKQTGPPLPGDDVAAGKQ